MRLHISGLFVVAAVVMAALPAGAQTSPFAGAWNITPEQPATGVYWLEVKDEGGKPTVMFLNRGGSPVAAQDVKLSGNDLSFMVGGTAQNRPMVTLARPRSPASVPRRGAPAMPTRNTRSASRSCCSMASRWTRGACRTRRSR
jgi:hypothetical protein